MENLYDFLQFKRLQWGRKTDNTIYVWSSGDNRQELAQIESQVNKNGACIIDVKFDKQCGKTYILIKHK